MRTKVAIVAVTLPWIVAAAHGRAQQPVQAPAAATPVRPYDAVSTTAMSITGHLRLSTAQLIFSRDLRYRTEPLSAQAGGSPTGTAAAGPAKPVLASAEYAKGAGSWASLLNLPAGTHVELRRVVAEEVGAQAPNRGLCGSQKTTFIALASAEDPALGTSLKLAAFSGTVPPGPSADARSLCGTFTYAPAAVKKRRP